MLQETVSQSLTLMCPFDDARDVCNNKSITLWIAHDPELRHQRGKRIIRDFRTSVGNTADESGLTRIGKTQQPHICHQFQFKLNPAFHPFFPGLVMLGCTIGRSFESCVSPASTSPFEEQVFL